ncbi:hypothetical protein M0R45_000314 [Rubus argutus]|uniref:Transmembrane protein n=1 Tax=Rubus argutus TaxID=59490 RepID=A0AAW1VPN1_RUBAR
MPTKSSLVELGGKDEWKMKNNQKKCWPWGTSFTCGDAPVVVRRYCRLSWWWFAGKIAGKVISSFFFLFPILQGDGWERGEHGRLGFGDDDKSSKMLSKRFIF